MAELKKKRSISEQFQPEQDNETSMTVLISDFAHGVRRFGHVQAIRIKSVDYTLLIMKDYISTLGEMKGTLSFVTEEDEFVFEDIKGFYCHRNNCFTLLVKEEKNVH